MNSALTTGRQATARLLVSCAVLFGLFFMHGAPAGAAEGCHGAMSTVATTPMSGGQDSAAMARAHPSAAHGAGPAVRAAEASGMPGTLCVSTPAHERVALPAPDLLVVAGAVAPAVWALARLRAAVAGTGRRGPPGGGRGLLLKVCVART
ncbi:hypothetical protein GCM10010521_71920 [Streptomyces rameus]|uniref:Uncharacterized protein n=1 Tax=Streptomyces rameus TaxID=68261 RepID=A0ABP6HNR5_9ACTN